MCVNQNMLFSDAVLPNHSEAKEDEILKKISNVLKYAPDSQGGGGGLVAALMKAYQKNNFNSHSELSC